MKLISMETLKKFGLEISDRWTGLPKEDYLNEVFNSIIETRCSYKENIDEIRNDFGIYAFFIKPKHKYTDPEHLQNVWEVEGFRKYPKVVKSRFSISVSIDGWFTFYIGKGEQLKNRVTEHINHSSQHSTYGLKLKDREDFLTQNEIEVGYWHLPPMENVLPEIKQFIITNFEIALRKRLNPWIGKQ